MLVRITHLPPPLCCAAIFKWVWLHFFRNVDVSKAMALRRSARIGKKMKEEERRVDMFKDSKPYLGNDYPMDIIIGNSPPRVVHNLSILCVRTVLRGRVPYERSEVPTAIRRTLDEYHHLLQWPCPRIMKCSGCRRFYTSQELFDSHTCHKH